MSRVNLARNSTHARRLASGSMAGRWRKHPREVGPFCGSAALVVVCHPVCMRSNVLGMPLVVGI